MILAKCCHDTDLLQWLIGEPCAKIQSFGTLAYFREENAPKDAPTRCLDECPHKNNCFYYAPDLYKINTAEVKHFRAIVANKFNPNDEEVDEILKTSPYGRCVFKCDNDVVDHQVVNLEFEDDVLCSFTMSSFGESGRYINIMGTKGNIRVKMEDCEKIPVYILEKWDTEYVDIINPAEKNGHSGGDSGIIDALYKVMTDTYTGKSVCTISQSNDNHKIVFAAEKSRLENTVVEL